MRKRRKALTKQLDALEQLQLDYRDVFNTPGGKRVLEDLEIRSFFKRGTITRADTGNMALVNEGRRQLFLHIVNMRDMDLVWLRQLRGEKEPTAVSAT